jgi:hypothetical protein
LQPINELRETMQSVNEEPLSKKSKVEPSTVTSEVSTAMTNKKKSSRGLKMKKLPERACAKEGDLLPPGHISYTVSHGEPSFATMRISSHEPLLKMDQRVKCPGCHSKRKYFCYRCYKILAPPNAVPQLTLPITVDIIHWPSELISKSTAIHAKLLAPTSVNIFEYPNFPDYNTEEVLLLYPTEDAIAVNDMDIETAKRIKRVVFVDSQWHAAHRILRHERLMKLTCVKFTAYKTFFWRYQQCGDECLATIEAIYYFFKEYHKRVCGTYNGEYDNLLFFFSFFYNLIQDKYKKEAKPFPRIQNYIKKDSSLFNLQRSTLEKTEKETNSSNNTDK